jgi:Cu(I)/Ag(I) efflux system periplasmic protein CusF
MERQVRGLMAMGVALALAACSPQAEKADPQGLAKGAGKIVVLQPEYGAVTIRHEPIPEYGMGAMTMEFTTEAERLKGLQVGDRVTFELKGPTEIETIQKE